jgi:GNAT superfamily N-acetyltransferase
MQVTEMAREFSAAALLPFSEGDFQAFYLSSLANPRFCFLVSDDLSSMLCACADSWLADRSTVIAQELFWWVQPEARGTGLGRELLNEFENWAKQIGARWTSVCNITHLRGNAVGKLFERSGYTKRESAYIKEL